MLFSPVPVSLRSNLQSGRSGGQRENSGRSFSPARQSSLPCSTQNIPDRHALPILLSVQRQTLNQPAGIITGVFTGSLLEFLTEKLYNFILYGINNVFTSIIIYDI